MKRMVEILKKVGGLSVNTNVTMQTEVWYIR